MRVSIKKAFKNIVKDKNWLLKFVILSILTILPILIAIPIALLTKGNETLTQIICVPIFFLFWLPIVGYNFKYLHDLIINPEADLPDWVNIPQLMLIGFKPLIPYTIFVGILGILSAIIVPLAMSGVGMIIITVSSILIPGLAIYIALSLNGLFLTYAASLKMGDIINFKKASKYHGVSYFIVIILFVFLAALTGIIFALPSRIIMGIDDIAYAFVMLIGVNLLSQLHAGKINAIKNNTKN